MRELLEAENDPSLTSLRVAVEGGGCSGFQYALGFDSGPDDDDETCEMHGVRVVVDRSSLPYLTGADVDYIDGLIGAGFQINNPNVVVGLRLRQLLPGEGRGRGGRARRRLRPGLRLRLVRTGSPVSTISSGSSASASTPAPRSCTRSWPRRGPEST